MERTRQEKGIQVAYTTSPAEAKRGTIALEVLKETEDLALLGQMVYLTFRAKEREGEELKEVEYLVLGKVSDLIREDPSFEEEMGRHALRRGMEPPGRDLLRATLEVGAVYRRELGRLRGGGLLALPPIGTPVYLLPQGLLEEIAQGEEIFYLGRIYGTGLPLPLRLPDMRREGYGLGIFGRTGSGKSVLAKSILAGYARRKETGLLLLDPQGEYAEAFRNRDRGGFPLPLGQIYARLGRKVEVLGIGDLLLDRWELLEELLTESPFFEDLTISRGENYRLAAQYLVERLRKEGIRLQDLSGRETFNRVLAILKDPEYQILVYRSKDSRERLAQVVEGKDPEELYARFKEVAEAFTYRPGARSPAGLVRFLAEGGVAVIDLAGKPEGVGYLVLERVLKEVLRQGEEAFREGRKLPLLILLDEAHRLVPARTKEEDEKALRLKRLVLDGVRTSRKAGIGWLFISQTLGSLDGELLRQLRFLFVGYGIGIGAEREKLREIAGEEGLAVYETFQDPEALGEKDREHPFMLLGPFPPLSTMGKPLFLRMFTEVGEFLKVNGF